VRQEPALCWALLDQRKIPAPERPPCYFAAWEKRHYRRLRSNCGRNRFLTGRFLVRQGLSRIRGGCCRPEQWCFLRTRYGRPVPAPACGRNFSFSLSYSGHLVVAALARDCHIGVDVERVCGHGLECDYDFDRAGTVYAGMDAGLSDGSPDFALYIGYSIYF